MNTSLIILFSFLAATSLPTVIFLLMQAAQSSPQARIRKRIMAVTHNPEASQAEIRTLLKGNLYSKIPWFQQTLAWLPFASHLNLLLERANLDISVGLLLLVFLATGSIGFCSALTLLDLPFIPALLSGAVVSLGPYLYVKYRARLRMRRFLEQLPDSLDMLSQGLQSGLGIRQALVFVAKRSPDPIGTELSIFTEALNLGLSMVEALGSLQERIAITETRLLSTAISVQEEIGGSLAELLNKLADVIRDRFRIEREIKTLTAQNRMSALVVCSLPPFLTVFMFVTQPTMMNEMLQDPAGRMMLIGALIFEILGILTFRRLLRLHI